MKIVILDGYTLNPGDLSWSSFYELGDVICFDYTDPDDVVGRIGDAEVVITNKTPINQSTINDCPNIKYIGVLATGFNVVDILAAKENGIPVCNIPAYGTKSVAQFVFAHLMNICHRVEAHNDSVQQGQWSNQSNFCYWNHPLIELNNKTMGIIGFGRIGQAVSDIARSFGMRVLTYNGEKNIGDKIHGIHCVSLDALYADADVITLHCPLTDKTEKMINERAIEKMKAGVIIINTSRGALIDEYDLFLALRDKKVFAAGLDVVSSEPIQQSNPLLNLNNCFITPHIAWAPKEARSRLMNIAVENLRGFLTSNIQNQVN